MYADADRLLNKRRLLGRGASKFEDLDRDHPYAPEARRAIVMAAYAYYKAGKYQEAIASAQRYTTLHPGTKDAALAHHIIASAHFDDIKDPTRDQTATRKALAELKILRAALSRQPLRQAGREPHPHRRGHAGRIGDERRALLSEAQQSRRPPSTASRRWWPTTRPRRTSRRRSTAWSRPTWRSASCREAQAAAAVLGHNFPNSDGTSTPMRC